MIDRDLDRDVDGDLDGDLFDLSEKVWKGLLGRACSCSTKCDMLCTCRTSPYYRHTSIIRHNWSFFFFLFGEHKSNITLFFLCVKGGIIGLF